jgi:predicted glycoside hydrolase/deacetylase ChbG (UPF0249 family)
MTATRLLSVVADDFGIGPETSRGILELASRRLVTGTVLLVNSPHAQAAVGAWHAADRPMEMGWHPCLTLDPPVRPASAVPSLVDRDGRLWPLGKFLPRLLTGRIRPGEIQRELTAQYNRFLDLVGRPPVLVNSHQHVAVFPPVGRILRGVLEGCRPAPLLRRIREPWALLAKIPGARIKRTVLSMLGRCEARRQECDGYPGGEWLAGITDPPYVTDPAFFTRWLSRIPGRVVELACHPGHFDPSLVGRDARGLDDGLLLRRIDEFYLLVQPAFAEACARAGFTLVPPSLLCARRTEGGRHAA